MKVITTSQQLVNNIKKLLSKTCQNISDVAKLKLQTWELKIQTWFELY